MDIKKLLAGTQFEDKTDCIADHFQRAGITTPQQLSNLPILLRGNICHIDIFLLTTVLVQRASEAKTEPGADSNESTVTKRSRRKKDDDQE